MLQATEGHGFLYIRDEVIDRCGTDCKKRTIQDSGGRFQTHRQSNVPTLCGLRAAIDLRIRWIGAHRDKTSWQRRIMFGEMSKRAPCHGLPERGLRCGIVTVKCAAVEPDGFGELLWKEERCGSRGRSSKLRFHALSCAAARMRQILAGFDEYKQRKREQLCFSQRPGARQDVCLNRSNLGALSPH